MPSTLEQRRPGEGQQEVVQTPERQSREIPEYDEAGLRELVDQAQVQVGADESRILESADRRMPDSMGMDQQKATSIFTSRGFSDRIKNAKNKINALTKNTREKISALARPKAEIQTQQAETRPKAEIRPSEATRAMTLDQYMSHYHSTGMETVRDKARLAQLQLKGIKNPERTLGFIHYLEDKATGHEYKTISVKNSERDQEQKKYQDQGYYVYFSEREQRGDKAQMKVSRDIPFHFEMRNARGIADLLQSSNDPVAVLERLQGMGYKMNGNDFAYNIENVKKFVDNPHILSLLEKFGAAEGKIGLQKDYGVFDYGGEAKNLLELAELDANSHLLNETAVQNLSAISEIVGHPLSNQSIESWVSLKNDPGTMELLLVVRDYGKIKFSKDNDADLARGLKAFKDAGISADVATLVKEGFDPKSFSIDNIDSYSIDQAVARITPTVQELKTNSGLHKFALEAFKALAITPTVEDEIFGKFRKYYENPKVLPVLQALGKCGVVSAQELKWGHSGPDEMLKNEKAVETISQPDFPDFLAAMGKAGFKVRFSDLFPPGHDTTELLRAYSNEHFRANIGKEENVLLANKLKLFQLRNWNVRGFEQLMQTPDAIKNLQTLEQKYNYQCNGSYNESEDLAFLFNSAEVMKGLLSPETEKLAEALKEFGYVFTIDFGSQGARALVELAQDSEFLKKISDPQINEFVKNVGAQYLPDIKALTNCDVTFHPVIKTLINEFGFYPSESSLEDKIKFAQLRDDPRIFEVARRLKDTNTNLHPLASLEKLKIIADKNLFSVIEQCKGLPQIQEVIINKAELFTGVPKEKLSGYLIEILNKTEGESVRANQMIRGELVGILLEQGKYDIIAEMAGEHPEHSAEIKRIVEKLKNFVESYKVSGKGRTIATLLSMREYRQGEDFSQLLARTERQIDAYENLLNRYSPHNIPNGLKASIGMEYEITQSTANGYGKTSGGNSLRTDMQNISRFANVGRGNDAVFEIATKPSDNPRLMLLEMQLLQDLEFIDLNFRQPGYERGARGYHMTIGGEYGINVSRNSNFLQNTLVMSGWGGINAGREVDKLSHGRSVNIRQRDAYSAQKVFENARPAVEFRSLSLDTWEPFERAVETSYYGAIAVQAFEKYI